jgi:GAF domain-containing protein
VRRELAPMIERVFARWWHVPLLSALVIALPIAILGEVAARQSSARLEASLAREVEDTARRGAVVASARLEEVGRIIARTASEPTVRSLLSTGAPEQVDHERTLRELRDLGLTPGTGVSVWFVDVDGKPFGQGAGITPGPVVTGVFREGGPAVMDRDSFRATKARAMTGSMRLSYTFVARGANTVAGPAVEIITPIQGGFTPFVGALMMEVPSAWFESALRPHVAGRDDLYLIDSSGVLTARAAEPPVTGIDLRSDSAFAQNGAVERDDPVARGSRYAASAAVGETGWRVIGVVDPGPPRAELQSSLAVDRGLRIALLAALLAGSVVIGRLGTRTVRRRQQLSEALEQQRATSAVLQVISSSPTDVQPVLDAVIENAVRLCDATNGSIVRLIGDELRVVAAAGRFKDRQASDAFWKARTVPRDRTSLSGRVMEEGRSVHVLDAKADPGMATQNPGGWFDNRTTLGVPLLRDGVAVGAIILRRDRVAAFAPHQIALVETFAGQAAIAIENVRLFNETKEALEQQTATAEVLRTMSQSVFDLERVLGTMVESVTRLCSADVAWINRLVDTTGYSGYGRTPELQSLIDRIDREASASKESPRPANPNWKHTAQGRAMTERRTVHIPDVLADDRAAQQTKSFAMRLGARTVLAVPLMRDATPIGTIIVARLTPRPFSPREVTLVETFADQAVIAVENVRLFNETKEALERQTATSEILRVISTSPNDLQPVLDAIAVSAQRYCGAHDVLLHLVLDGHLVTRAHVGPIGAALGTGGSVAISRDSAPGLAAIEKRTVHVPDMAVADEFPVGNRFARELGFHTALAMPLVRGEDVLGTLLMRREEIQPFSPRDIELAETFAAQAAIAIENVRLFNETREALDRQTAVSDILKVISASPTDIQPVLDAIASSAARFTGAEDVSVLLVQDGAARTRAHYGPITNPFSIPLDRGSVTGAAILDARLVHVPDVTEGDDYPVSKRLSLENDNQRTVLAAPLVQDGRSIGAIVLRSGKVRALTQRQVELVRTFADQAVIAIENVRLFNETKESLERQTALAEILRAIAASPSELGPVFAAIASSARRFCRAEDASVILRLPGDVLHVVSHEGPLGEVADWSTVDWPLDRASVSGRAIVDQRVVHVHDLLAEGDEFPVGRAQTQMTGNTHRTTLAAPLVRGGHALGAILLRRAEVRPFSDRQVELLTAFADQSVIAIENVRLFNETKDALERQTAVSEILRVMAGSPTDVAPVLQAIAESAARFCGAENVSVILEGEDGLLHPLGHVGALETRVRPFPVDRTTVTGRSMLEGQPVHVHDLQAESEEFPLGSAQARTMGHRTTLATPLVRAGRAFGAILLRRGDVRPFTEKQVELVRTFADQAVIAIENVRLFNETKEALAQQTAVSDVLATISRSAFDLQPVLDTVTERATRLSGATQGVMYRVDGELLRYAAGFGPSQELMDLNRRNPIHVGDRGTLSGRVTAERRTVHLPDVLADPDYTYREAQELGGFRAMLGVPLLREGNVIGVMSLWRTEPAPFGDREIAIVETFADQAAIAIENVRLFNETKEALEQQRAVAEVLQTISRSVFDLQPVLDTVVENTARLASAEVALLSTSEGRDSYRVAAVHGAPVQDPNVAALWAGVQRQLGRAADARSVMGRMLVGREVIHIEDLRTEPELLKASVMLRATGARTVLAVPMLREGRSIGGVIVARLAVRRFSDREIELVQTFADQAAIAIQNTRLFSEIRAKSQQLELASRHKSEFLANMSHELRTPLNAIIGFSEVLLQGMFGGLNDKQREYQQDVLSSGRHLLTLINDILDLSKIEAGHVELELGEFSLPEALENGVTMIRERAARHGIRVQVDVAGVDRIVADERKVKQIVFNLLSNAVKFTPDGGRVDVSAAPNNGEVRVAVRDNGIGIDQADRERIFEEFQQASRDPERSREGTGLGLALSKRYVELHGGRIWVDSEVGKGSTFTFALPLISTGEAER